MADGEGEHSSDLATSVAGSSTPSEFEYPRLVAPWRHKTCSTHCTLSRYEEDFCAPRELPYGVVEHLSHQPFQAKDLYTPIGGRQIRILELHPGSPGENLSADLHVATFLPITGVSIRGNPSTVHFEALSYCWGRPICNRYIRCNGQLLPVTTNLYDGLQRFRHKDKTRYLWVDAICINQQDQSERSHQIQSMLPIYRKARKVLVWLGEHGNHTRLALHCVALGTASEIPAGLISIISKPLCTRHEQAFLLGLHDLLSRDWYDRLWVKQEVWAAQVVEMVCADHTLPWNVAVTLACELLSYRQDCMTTLTGVDLADYQNPFEGLTRVLGTFERHKGQNPPEMSYNLSLNLSSTWDSTELFRVLRRASGARCSDLRDYVYGILGMTETNYGTTKGPSASTKPLLEINYNNTVTQVYLSVVNYYIQQRRSLLIFHCLCREGAVFGGNAGAECLPSWCPNWSVIWEEGRLFNYRKHGQEPVSSSDYGPYDPDILAEIPSIEGPPYVLRLEGVHFAKVRTRVRMPHRVPDPDKVATLHHHGTSERYALLQSDHPFLQKLRNWDGSFESFIATAKQRSDRSWTLHGKVAKADDIIVAVQGSLNPFVLRRQQDKSCFQFVGVASMYRFGDDMLDPSERPRDASSFLRKMLAAAASAALLDEFHVL